MAEASGRGVRAKVIADSKGHVKMTFHNSESSTVKGSIPGPSKDSNGTANCTSDLVYENGTLVSGTLEALIDHLVPTHDHVPHKSYPFAFLLCSRLFIPPHELLQRLCQICSLRETIVSSDEAKRIRFSENVVHLFGEWTQKFPYDFRDERMMKQLKDITQRCIGMNCIVRADVVKLVEKLLFKLKSLEKYEASEEEHAAKIKSEMARRLAYPSRIDVIQESVPCSRVLAENLTYIELYKLKNIGAEEFVQAFIKDNTRADSRSVDARTKNLEAYIQWFNRLSYFVATEVCVTIRYPRRVSGGHVIDYFINVAKHCCNLGNFNSMMAVMAGLNMTPVSRLKKQWSKIDDMDIFKVLEHQMDPSSNFTSYRSSFKAAKWRSDGPFHSLERMLVIPFFSLFVKDLYFLNEGCSNKLPNGHVNFDKFWQLSKQVDEFMHWQTLKYPFSRSRLQLNSLLTNSVYNDSALALISFECEPPENEMEKKHYKALKAEHAA